MITFEEYLKDHLEVTFDSYRFKELFDDMIFDLENSGKKRSMERHELYAWINSKVDTVSHIVKYVDSEFNMCEISWIKPPNDVGEEDSFFFMYEPIIQYRLSDGSYSKSSRDIQECLYSMYEEFINITTNL